MATGNKPGDCMKHMHIEMHPALLEAPYCALLDDEVLQTGAHLVPSPELWDPGLVLWSRTVPRLLHHTAGQVQVSAPKESCARALYVLSAEEAGARARDGALAAHVALAREVAGCGLTLVVYGVAEYFKKAGGRKNASGAERPQPKNKRCMSLHDFQMAKTDLLVGAGCDTLEVNTPEELALTIVRFTKAIAESPYKSAQNACYNEAEFYMKGDNKNCVAVDSNGNGLDRLWQQMIAVLPMSSLETSRAFCAKCKTPRDLYKKLLNSDGVNEIADIEVSRSAVPGASARRAGPEFARRLHTLFTSENGNDLV